MLGMGRGLSVHGRTRTSNPCLRRAVLYPIELHGPGSIAMGRRSFPRSRSRILIGGPDIVEETLGEIEFGSEGGSFLAFSFQGGFQIQKLIEGDHPTPFQTSQLGTDPLVIVISK